MTYLSKPYTREGRYGTLTRTKDGDYGCDKCVFIDNALHSDECQDCFDNNQKGEYYLPPGEEPENYTLVIHEPCAAEIYYSGVK